LGKTNTQEVKNLPTSIKREGGSKKTKGKRGPKLRTWYFRAPKQSKYIGGKSYITEDRARPKKSGTEAIMGSVTEEFEETQNRGKRDRRSLLRNLSKNGLLGRKGKRN